MAFRDFLWMENAGSVYNAGEYRHLLYALCEGVGGISKYGDLAVSQRGAGANMSVDVAAGRCYVIGTENAMQGAYFGTNEAAVNLAIGTADGSNPRNDLIVVRVQDDEYSGGVTTGGVVVVPGSPAASPADPAVPANSLRLARVRVNAGATSITNANITDLRQLAPPAKNARGRLTRVEFNLDTGLIDTTPQTVAGSAMGYTVTDVGRRVTIDYEMNFRSSVAGDAFLFHIRNNGGNVHGGQTIPVVTPAQDFVVRFSQDGFTPLAGGNIADLTVVRIAGSGLGRVQGVGSIGRVKDDGGIG